MAPKQHASSSRHEQRTGGSSMRRQRFGVMVAVALSGLALGSLPSVFAAVDANGFVIVKPDEIKYQPNESGGGPDIAVIYGDPTKAGFYIIRAGFKPGVMSRPHTPPTARSVTDLSGM